MGEAEDREQQRRAKAGVFKEVDDMWADQRAAGGDPSLNRLEFPDEVAVGVRLTRDMHAQLQQIAHREGLSMRRLLRIGVELVLQHAQGGTLPKLPNWPAEPDQD